MARHILGGALAALLIVSDRIAFVVLAVAMIVAVRIVIAAQTQPETSQIVRLKIPAGGGGAAEQGRTR